MNLYVISAQNATIATQLKMYSDNRDAFIAAMSEAQYNNNKITTDLLAKLPLIPTSATGLGVGRKLRVF